MRVDNDDMTRALGAIRDASQVPEVQLKALEAARLCGIKRIYAVAPLVRDSRRERSLTNLGFPRVWERHYRARLAHLDPLPALSLDFSNAFRWPEDVADSALSPDQRRYMEIAAKYGHRRIIGTACYGPQGRAIFFGGSWDADTPPADTVMLAVHQIGQTSFQRYCQLVREDHDIPVMSNRELDVLGLMCRGRSNPGMAEELGISRSSVDAYIRRIFAKLEVNDRTAACVRAFSIGLVTSEEVDRLVRRAREREAKAV